MTTSPTIPKNKTIGLTLSGGGMRGIAHIGVLKALDEFGIRPNMISGTSAGALIGAFYSLGIRPQQMQDVVRERTFFSRSAFRLSRQSLFSTNFILHLLQEFFPENDFKTLKIPLFVATTELTQGRIEFFNKGPLFEALIASASIPLVFSPVKMNDKVYVDGGVLDNLPIEPLVPHCDFIVASHVNALRHESFSKINLLKTFDRILHLAIASSVYSKISSCDLFLEPPAISQYSLFKKNNTDEMIESAYNYCCEKLELMSRKDLDE